MSLLSPEKLNIHLAPGIALVARTQRSAIIQSDARAVAADAQFGWQPVIEALSDILSGYADMPAMANVTLSSRLAPVVAMPWREDVTTPESQALLSALRLARSHGGSAADWDCIAADNGYGQTWLASGARHEFMVALKSALGAARIRPGLIAPLAVDLFNTYAASLSARGATWLLVPESDRLTAWYCRGRVPQECLSLPLPENAESVPALLRREALLRGLPDQAAARLVIASQLSGALAEPGVQRLLPRWRCAPGVTVAYPLHWLGSAR